MRSGLRRYLGSYGEQFLKWASMGLAHQRSAHSHVTSTSAFGSQHGRDSRFLGRRKMAEQPRLEATFSAICLKQGKYRGKRNHLVALSSIFLVPVTLRRKGFLEPPLSSDFSLSEKPVIPAVLGCTTFTTCISRFRAS